MSLGSEDNWGVRTPGSSVKLLRGDTNETRSAYLDMRIDVTAAALTAGMSNEPAGTHTSRTIMLDELTTLLLSCPPAATYEDYSAAVVDGNVLGKATLATRKKSLRHLRELYSLRGDVPVFAGLRSLWWDDSTSRPLLAILCAAARDPLLRSTADVVIDAPVSSQVGATDLADAIETAFPHRFATGVRARIGRNAASSWTQSGHLRGRTNKVRTQAQANPAAAAYALYLGHLADETGSALFRTLWSRLLDAPEGQVRDLAAGASRLGWITYRSAAAMTEVTFRQLESTAGAPTEVFA